MNIFTLPDFERIQQVHVKKKPQPGKHLKITVCKRGYGMSTSRFQYLNFFKITLKDQQRDFVFITWNLFKNETNSALHICIKN